MRTLAAILAVLALLVGPARAQEARAAQPGKFDYYVLALSWSPSFCAIPNMSAREPQQCGPQKRYGFIVHGLWPQYERGWPSDCAVAAKDAPEPVARKMLDIMPSPKLIQHEWDEHGGCSGLSPQSYFDLTRALRAKVTTPRAYTALDKPLITNVRAVRAEFVKANPGLGPDMVSVTCNRGKLRDVLVCFTKEGKYRRCAEDARDRCDQPTITLPPTRGR